MHPNCRHEFLPFHESFVGSSEELEKVIEKSNHFENFDKNHELFKLYNADQALQRQWIKESREFHNLTAELGDNMPYKTLGSFRRASRSKSEEYVRIYREITELGSAKKDEKILDFYATKRL